MAVMNDHTIALYSSDDYIIKNPTLHEEDSPWKISLITPLVDTLMTDFDRDEVNLLDVGGGAGLISSRVSAYLAKKYNKRVNKYALDLSPGMLSVQELNNPDMKMALNEDIRETSLPDKCIDLILMIDTIEHIPEPDKALRELKRISSHVIFKVPLEDNLKCKINDIATGGEYKKALIEKLGHINVYNISSLTDLIRASGGTILGYYYTNVFDYYNRSGAYKNRFGLLGKSINVAGSQVYKISPSICSRLFNDFVMVLVRY